jgi:hypothetical protein
VLYSLDAQLPADYRSFVSSASVITSHRGDCPSVSEICARVNDRVDAIVELRKKASLDKSGDQDRSKGAVEQDSQNEGGNTSMRGKLGHRDDDAELKNADSDLRMRLALCRSIRASPTVGPKRVFPEHP